MTKHDQNIFKVQSHYVIMSLKGPNKLCCYKRVSL